MPSQPFAVNAAWLKLAIMSYNIASAIKGLCFSPEERTARCKKYRLLLVHVAGRMNRNNCVMRHAAVCIRADHRAPSTRYGRCSGCRPKLRVRSPGRVGPSR